MTNKMYGFTLIELVVTIALLVIVLTAGTAIFFRSFKSSGISDIQTTLNNSLTSLDDLIERSLRYGNVVRVSNQGVDSLRPDCIAAGDTGVSGNVLAVTDSSGGTAIYSLLTDGTVSSNSGVIISNPSVFFKTLKFTWYCRSGVNDKMNLLIEATSSGGVSASMSKDINLLNSGIN